MRSTQRFEDRGCGRRSAEGEYYFLIRPQASKRKQKIEGKLASSAPTICFLREQAARPLFVLLENCQRAALGGRRISYLVRLRGLKGIVKARGPDGRVRGLTQQKNVGVRYMYPTDMTR